MSQLAIDQVKIAGRQAVRLSGRLDTDTSPALRTVLLRHADRQGVQLLIDLGDVEFMDTSGLATLIEAHGLLRGQGGKMVLFGVPAHILELFAVNKTESVFHIYRDEEAAVGAPQ